MNLLKTLTQIPNEFGSFNKLKIKEKTAHIKANSIGCFMLNGFDTIEFPNHTKSEDFCHFFNFNQK